MLPPIPSWDALHPVIVHFPIALLLVAPILVLIGSFVPNKTRNFLIAAFILMLIGTITAKPCWKITKNLRKRQVRFLPL